MDCLKEVIDNPKLVLKYSVDSFDAATKTIDLYCKDLAPWQIVFYSVASSLIAAYLYNFYHDIDTDMLSYLKKKFFTLAKKIPYVSSKIKTELESTKETLEGEILKANKGFDYVRELPKVGLTNEELNKQIEKYLTMGDNKWKDGACSGCVYGADDDLTELTTSVFQKFTWTNVMHADVFPEVRKMEAEVVRIVCQMFNGDSESCGTMTSGGTESILLSCKAARDLAYKRGVKRPEIVMPVTAHAAFDKAAHYFGMRIHHVPVDPVTKRAVPKEMKKYINSNTCLLVGSAPGYPHGVIDPIEEIGKLGLKYNIPVHVDACLGGFLVAFMEEAGFTMPCKFDFRVPGVTQISCDTHKYGYTPKGSSVIMYRNRDYRENQFFSCTDWPGGLYASPTIAGSRPGVNMALTWSTLMHFGRDGYVDATRRIVNVARYIASEVKTIKELRLMSDVDVSIVAFDSTEFNILKLMDEMSHTWHLNALQNPPGIHIAVTKLQTKPGVAERFVKDLKEAVARIMQQSDRKLGKIAQIYCTSQSVPDRSIIADVSYLYLDACYNTNSKPLTGNGKTH